MKTKTKNCGNCLGSMGSRRNAAMLGIDEQVRIGTHCDIIHDSIWDKSSLETGCDKWMDEIKPACRIDIKMEIEYYDRYGDQKSQENEYERVYCREEPDLLNEWQDMYLEALNSRCKVKKLVIYTDGQWIRSNVYTFNPQDSCGDTDIILVRVTFSASTTAINRSKCLTESKGGN